MRLLEIIFLNFIVYCTAVPLSSTDSNATTPDKNQDIPTQSIPPDVWGNIIQHLSFRDQKSVLVAIPSSARAFAALAPQRFIEIFGIRSAKALMRYKLDDRPFINAVLSRMSPEMKSAQINAAAHGRDSRQVKFLLSNGVDVNVLRYSIRRAAAHNFKKDLAMLREAVADDALVNEVMATELTVERLNELIEQSSNDLKNGLHDSGVQVPLQSVHIKALDELLVYAALYDSRELFNALLMEGGADVHSSQGLALSTATGKGHLEVCEKLLNLGANPNDRRPLATAAIQGNNPMVELLLNYGADVNINFDQPLSDASAKGKLETVKLLLKNGANPKRLWSRPLRRAAAAGHTAIVRLLIENGANPRALDDEALVTSATNGRLDVFHLLLEHGCDVRARENAALRGAAANGHEQIVKKLLLRGANVHSDDDYALRAASANDRLGVVQLLLENGAFVHALEDFALRLASSHGHAEVVQLLLNNGANVHALFDNSLLMASKNGHTDVVEILLDNDADVNALFDAALRAASAKGHLPIAGKLIEKGADVNVLNGNPLYSAAFAGNLNMIKLLLSNGAIVKTRIVEVAERFGHKAAVILLKQHGFAQAAGKGDLQRVRWLLARGSPIKQALTHTVMPSLSAEYAELIDGGNFLTRMFKSITG